MKVLADRIVTLGFGKYVRADNIVALVPILRDMVGAESGAAELLRELRLQIGQVRPLLKSSIRSEAGLDLDELSRRITDLTGEQASPQMF